MRKIIFSGLIELLCSLNSLSAQNINGPIDSVQNLLCRNWEVDYVLMGGMKIGRMPGATEMNYQFNKDRTFFMSSNDPNDKTKGIWNYDSNKKVVKLSISGGTNSQIVSLSDSEFVMLIDANATVPDDLKDVQMICKPKKNSSVNLESVKSKQGSNETSKVKIRNTSLKKTDSSIMYVGVQNIIEIDGVNDDKILVMVAGAGASLRKVNATKYVVVPSKKGILTLSIYQTPKFIAEKQYAVVSRK